MDTAYLHMSDEQLKQFYAEATDDFTFLIDTKL